MEHYEKALKAATLEWEGVLTKLWTAFGKPLDVAQFRVYREELNTVPLGALEHVVGETIKRHKYNSVPTLAEIHTVLRELHPDHEVEEYEHTRPHRAAADRSREQGTNYPRAVDEYKEWVHK
jgi:hypothetical protein